jgi:maltooligosyltrehalose trehalohydrolase
MTAGQPNVMTTGTARTLWRPYFGAIVEPAGAQFRIWAPTIRTLTLMVRDAAGTRQHQPIKLTDGTWQVFVPGVSAGTRYAYCAEGGDPRPDPVSRFQPDGVHGWSELVEPSAFSWSDDDWRGLDPARVVLYELHVGTFSHSGTFRGAAERLPYLRDLGITAVELMPLADFPGRWNWGYDGAALFAPSRAYGRPDDLRAFVDSAHRCGIAVIVDVVYNHLGPEGAYLAFFSPQILTDTYRTPWGKAINLDCDGCVMVRQLLIENALHWVHEYHIDGLRLDATHTLHDSTEPHFVAELAAAVHAARPIPTFVFAEDSRNLAALIRTPEEGGWGLDGVWADDFHHILRRMLGEQAHGYYRDYEGRMDELVETLRRGWFYVGQWSKHKGGPRGTDPADVAMQRAIICVQNHDQVGNRVRGDRLHHMVEAAAWRAAVTLLLTAPMTPLLFMGQEWSASTPFQFFTDFEPVLGEQVVQGRRREFRSFEDFAAQPERIPNPQDPATFEASRLNWDERDQPEHGAALALHTALLQLRAAHPGIQGGHACTCRAQALDDSTILVRREWTDRDYLICARLRGAGQVVLGAEPHRSLRPLLITEDPQFALDPEPPALDLDRHIVTFRRPGAVVFELAPESSHT